MFTTEGVDAIASVTELRSKTAELLDAAQGARAILVQRNNAPAAVVIGYDRYMELIAIEAKRKKKSAR